MPADDDTMNQPPDQHDTHDTQWPIIEPASETGSLPPAVPAPPGFVPLSEQRSSSVSVEESALPLPPDAKAACISVRIVDGRMVFQGPWKVLEREQEPARRDRIGEMFDRASDAQLVGVSLLMFAVSVGLAAILK